MKTQLNTTGIFGKAMLTFVLTLIISAGTFAQTSHDKFSLKNLFHSNKAEEVEVMRSSVIATVEIDLYEKSLDFVFEKPVQVENWMTDAAGWEVSNTTEKEEAPELENWMTDLSEFNNTTEQPVRLAAWMHSADCWSNK